MAKKNRAVKKVSFKKDEVYLLEILEERYNNLHFYEEGKIAALLWILGLNETTDIEELVKNV